MVDPRSPEEGADGQRGDPSPATESSIELLRRAQHGDGEALEKLVARYVPSLRRWARGRLPVWARDLIDTDDVVQDTLLQTLRRLEDFEPRHDGALQAYLRQALHNRILMEIRRARRRPRIETVSAEIVDRSTSPLEQAVGQESLELYERALGRLKVEDREAVVLRLEFGLDYGELAESLGKPSANAARMAVSRALVRLAAEVSHGRS